MPRGVTERYRGPGDLPQVLPLFPLRGAILLPRATLALNVFEPRYLLLVDYALAGDRLIGIVQPAPDANEVESPAGKAFPLRRIGCAGRITAFSEGDGGRLMLSLTGIARFKVIEELTVLTAYRQRNLPLIHGTLRSISPDALTDERTGSSYFVAKVEVRPEDLARLEEVKLVPGMPAEVMLMDGEQSVLSYLLGPILDSARRSLREN